MDIFNLFGYGALVSVLLFLLLYFMLFIVPCLIIAKAIKSLKESCYYDVIGEESDYYIISYKNMRIYKNWYIADEDCFLCLYGCFVPQYSFDDKIIGFTFYKTDKR